jgi:hypothetical protein
MITKTPASTVNAPAIARLTLAMKMMATTVAAHGGITFQTNMFSSVKTAFEVAVIRLVKVPGMRSAK